MKTLTRVMDWDKLIFGHYNIDQIQQAVADPKWQEYRTEAIGTSLESKYIALQDWLEDNNHSERAKIQVTNYVNALKRGGLVPT